MKKILIVEDDPFLRDITTVKLSEHGYSIVAVENGEAALTALSKETFDVLLLDLDLPDIHGFEVITKMKEVAMVPLPNIIIFSNSDDPQAKEKAANLGVCSFFVKATTDYNELYTVIDSL